MFTKCPTCGSLNLRRSSIRSSESPARPVFRSPYRCRDCGERFWVISRRAVYLGGLATVAVVAGTVAWNAGSAPNEPRHEPARATATVENVADTMQRAGRDDPVAQYTLARMYAHGKGIEANRKEAQTWLERAAENGNTDAQYELGNALRDGLGVVQDYERAAKWLQLAALSGNANAQYALGQMYRLGMGLPTDNAKAYTWFNLAAAQDVAGAAPQRDAVLRVLTPSQVLEAQAEARHLSQSPQNQSALER